MHQEASNLERNSCTEKNPTNHGRELGARTAAGNSHALLHGGNEDHFFNSLLYSSICHFVGVHQYVHEDLEIRRSRQ